MTDATITRHLWHSDKFEPSSLAPFGLVLLALAPFGLDMKKRFSEEQIIKFLGEGESGVAVKELCRRFVVLLWAVVLDVCRPWG